MPTKTARDLTRVTLASISKVKRTSSPQRSSETKQPASNATPTKKPLETNWQRKWLNLEQTHPKLQEMANEIESWCGRFYTHSTDASLLVISGKPGNGKTRSARAVYGWLGHIAIAAFEARSYPRAPLISFFHWPAVSDAIREDEFGAVEEAFEADGLILDDVGADDDPWKKSADKLCQILSRRERKFTLLTTNIERKEWAEKFDGRIVDRFMRNSVVVNLAGVPSYSTR